MGKALYGIYRAVALQSGVETDKWEDLEDWNRAAWEKTAEIAYTEAAALLGRK